MLPMNGPGGTAYDVFADGPNGRAGIAQIEDGQSRIRIEPVSQEAADIMLQTVSDNPHWTEPTDGNLRLSIVVDESEKVELQDLARRLVGASAE